MLLERALPVERLGPDVPDHDGIAHEMREPLEVRIVPWLEAQAWGLDDGAHAELVRASGHGQTHRRFGALALRSDRAPPCFGYGVAACVVSASIGTISSARSWVEPRTTGAAAPARWASSHLEAHTHH